MRWRLTGKTTTSRESRVSWRRPGRHGLPLSTARGSRQNCATRSAIRSRVQGPSQEFSQLSLHMAVRPVKKTYSTSVHKGTQQEGSHAQSRHRGLPQGSTVWEGALPPEVGTGDLSPFSADVIARASHFSNHLKRGMLAHACARHTGSRAGGSLQAPGQPGLHGAQPGLSRALSGERKAVDSSHLKPPL